jgi:hypothetical protein
MNLDRRLQKCHSRRPALPNPLLVLNFIKTTFELADLRRRHSETKGKRIGELWTIRRT